MLVDSGQPRKPPLFIASTVIGDFKKMDIYEKYRKAFLKVLELTELSKFNEIESDEQLFYDLSSISNTEMYFVEFRDKINGIQTNKLIEMLISLSNLESKFHRSREKDWYFVNTFSQFRQIVYYRIDDLKETELTDYFLKNRKNERMPFAKDMSFSIDSKEKFFDYKQQEKIRLENHTQKVLNEQLLSEEKKKERLAHSESSEKTFNDRKKYLDWFEKLTDYEKISEVIKSKKPINYYGDNYDYLKIDLFSELKIDDLDRLIKIIIKANVKSLKSLVKTIETRKNHR